LEGLTSTSTVLTVTGATVQSIAITPSIATTIYIGAPFQFTATGTFSDSSTQDLTAQVTWKSATTAVATVSNTAGSNGVVTPVKVGTTTISASLAGKSATSAIITVSAATLQTISIAPLSPSVKVAKTLQLTATGHYSDGSSQDLTKSTSLTWSSSNTAVATVANKPPKNKGLAKGVMVGTVTIKAQMKGSASGTTTLTVN
jgi:uncharacterized protein YjdB